MQWPLRGACGILSWTTKEPSFSSTTQVFLRASKARQRTSCGGRFCFALREQTVRRRLHGIPEFRAKAIVQIHHRGDPQLFLCMAGLRGTELSAFSRGLSLTTFESRGESEWIFGTGAQLGFGFLFLCTRDAPRLAVPSKEKGETVSFSTVHVRMSLAVLPCFKSTCTPCHFFS